MLLLELTWELTLQLFVDLLALPSLWIVNSVVSRHGLSFFYILKYPAQEFVGNVLPISNADFN